MSKKKQGVISILAQQSLQSLYGYLVICVGCGIAMIVNLIVQKVDFSAFSVGSEDEKKLLVLTIAVVTFCVLMVCVLLMAVGEKKEKEKYTRAAAQKKKR